SKSSGRGLSPPASAPDSVLAHHRKPWLRHAGPQAAHTSARLLQSPPTPTPLRPPDTSQEQVGRGGTPYAWLRQPQRSGTVKRGTLGRTDHPQRVRQVV